MMRNLLAYLSILSYAANTSCKWTSSLVSIPAAPPVFWSTSTTISSLTMGKMTCAQGMSTYTKTPAVVRRRQVLGLSPLALILYRFMPWFIQNPTRVLYTM